MTSQIPLNAAPSPGLMPSGSPLDMDFLNSITLGKAFVLEELLTLFFANAGECLMVMESSNREGDSERWRKATAELKMLSDNVGAVDLSKCTAIAQKANTASLEEKNQMLLSVQAELQKLRTFVRANRV